MKIKNRAINLGAWLLIIAASFTFHLKAQNLELGVQWNQLSFRSGNSITENVSSNPNRGMDLGGNFFLQQIKDKKYIRFSAGLTYGNRTSSSISTSGNEERESKNNFNSLSLGIGFELGRIWRLGKKFRIQTGIRWALGRVMTNNSKQTNSSFDANRDLISSTISTTKGPGALSATNLLVGRVDYKLGERVRIGLGFQWGLSFRYSNIKLAESSTTTFGNGATSIQVDSERTLKNANLSLTGLSRPLLNIGFMIGK